MPVHPKHVRRQDLPIPSLTVTQSNNGPAPTSLILAPGSGGAASESAPPLASDTAIVITLSSSPILPSTSSAEPSPSVEAAAVKSSSSSIALSTVVGACVGAFIGLALVICLFIWWTRHSTTKSRRAPRTPVSEHRNGRGEVDERPNSGAWGKLDDDSEGVPPMAPLTRQMTQQEIDEKNFPMFKKRSPSVRTTKTSKALEDHGIDMPPFELSKYHPHLAEQFALQEPDKPFASRQDSGMSWDGETVGDDSFLSLRSVRIESGTMSPTLSMAKMTPPTMVNPLHRWESAEVISFDDSAASSSMIQTPQANPFVDTHVIERRKSNGNPFFGASDERTTNRRRSRSNSRGRMSREPSRAHLAARTTVVSEVVSVVNPFEDIAYAVDATAEEFRSHGPHDSIASGSSASAFSPSHRAMESLIAALDLSKEEVEARLRVASMEPAESLMYIDEEDIGTVRNYPPTPTTSNHL